MKDTIWHFKLSRCDCSTISSIVSIEQKHVFFFIIQFIIISSPNGYTSWFSDTACKLKTSVFAVCLVKSWFSLWDMRFQILIKRNLFTQCVENHFRPKKKTNLPTSAHIKTSCCKKHISIRFEIHIKTYFTVWCYLIQKRIEKIKSMKR